MKCHMIVIRYTSDFALRLFPLPEFCELGAVVGAGVTTGVDAGVATGSEVVGAGVVAVAVDSRGSHTAFLFPPDFFSELVKQTQLVYLMVSFLFSFFAL